MLVRHIRPAIATGAIFCTLGMVVPQTAQGDNATSEEIDAAVKFYDSVKADPKKHKAYCDVKQNIEMMTSGPAKFAEARQKMAAATKQLGTEFAKAQELSTRLDKTSGSAEQYVSARQALDKTCP